MINPPFVTRTVQLKFKYNFFLFIKKRPEEQNLLGYISNKKIALQNFQITKDSAAQHVLVCFFMNPNYTDFTLLFLYWIKQTKSQEKNIPNIRKKYFKLRQALSYLFTFKAKSQQKASKVNTHCRS